MHVDIFNLVIFKVDFKPENLARLFEWLGKAPMWTTIRWNKNCLTDSNRALESVQQFLEKVVLKSLSFKRLKLLKNNFFIVLCKS